MVPDRLHAERGVVYLIFISHGNSFESWAFSLFQYIYRMYLVGEMTYSQCAQGVRVMIHRGESNLIRSS